MDLLSMIIASRKRVDPDAAAYFARIEAAGSSINFNNRNAVNQFIVGCKEDGIWNAIKASCILAGADTLSGALVPLVGSAPTNFNFVNADYSVTTGLIGDGSTKYLDTNRLNNADPQDNCSSSLWITQDTTVTCTLIGATNANGIAARNIYGTSTRKTSMCNNSGPNATVLHTQLNATGFVGISRIVPEEYKFRHAGVTDTVLKASNGNATTMIRMFRQGNSSTAFSNARMSFYSIGENLDLALLDARLATLMSSLI